MQRFGISFVFLCLVLSSFHGELVNGNFNFTSDKLDENSLTSVKNERVDSSGTLTLNASSGDAQAFYSKPISVYDPISRSVLSFTSSFTFASDATSGNGTVAFVLMPNPTAAGGLTSGRKTFTVEFNTSCSTGGPFNRSGQFDGGYPGDGDRGAWPGGRGGPGFGGLGGLGGFQVIEYANNSAISSSLESGYGPNWSGQFPESPYFCSQQPPSVDLTNPTFQYQVVLEYNASTDSVSLGSPSCGTAIALTAQFPPSDLSTIITEPVFVGFIVTGGVYNISQWSFTSNVTTNSVESLALSSVVTPSSSGTSGGGSSDGIVDGRRWHSGRKLSKWLVIVLSILGAAIGITAVLAVCCLCERRRRVTSTRFVAAKSVHGGRIPEGAIIFDARKPNAPPAKVVLSERDTDPLNTRPNSTSVGTATWLPPLAPR